MKFQPYKKYKPSGVEWFDTVPDGWSVKRLRFCTMINPPKAGTRSLVGDIPVSFVPMEAVGEYGGLRLDRTRLLDDVAKGYTYFCDGDVVVAKITPCFENGKGSIAVGLKNGIGFGTTELHVLRPLPSLDRKYLFYLTISDSFRRIGVSYMYGAGGQKRVPDDFIRDFRHPIPSLKQQQTIASFLDRETARIDALIEKKTRQIELLKEKRAALISHAVTKGLNPNVKMKDSGVDWLGEIPAHWIKKRVKFTSTLLNGYAFDSNIYLEEGIPIIRIGDVGGKINWSEIKRVPSELLPSLRRFQVLKGDILLAMTGATIGKSSIYDSDEIALLNQRVGVIRCKNISQSFLQYFISSDCFTKPIEFLCYGGAQDNIGKEDIGDIYISIPEKEQQAISSFLDRETARIDKLIEKVQQSIELLKEYRTALISAAVTGKIDVHEE